MTEQKGDGGQDDGSPCRGKFNGETANMHLREQGTSDIDSVKIRANREVNYVILSYNYVFLCFKISYAAVCRLIFL